MHLRLALAVSAAVVLAAATSAGGMIRVDGAAHHAVAHPAPPPFVTPPGGSSAAAPNAFGGQTVTLYRADGSVFATRVSDAQGRPLSTRYDLGGGVTTEVDATYGSSGARSLARRSPRHLAASCGNDVRNPLSVKWATTEQWYLNTSTVPGYLNLTNTITGLRDAHTEWTHVVNWCNIADASGFSTNYGGVTTARFGGDGLNVVDWGSVAALGLSGCSAPNTIACTEWWTLGSEIVESDTRFDNTGRTTWVNGSVSGKTDVQSTEAHEMGHTAGFGHVNDSTNVMYPTIFTNDTSNRKLGKGDAREDNAKY